MVVTDEGQFAAELDEFGARAARVYGAAADHFTDPSLDFWDRFGAETVRRASLRRGDVVLDLCCGAGASALPAAQAVGPSGRVIGVDVAEPLLRLARARASAQGLANAEFRLADAGHTGLPSGSCDAVICVFGVFFVADMTSFLAEMWRLLRPGGRLAVTTWGEGLFEPADAHFWSAINAADPTLVRTFNPWEKITTPVALRALFAPAGIEQVEVDAVAGLHRLSEPAAFWDVVLGSGYRGTIDALEPRQQATVHNVLVRTLTAAQVTTVRTDVVYGLARKPHGSPDA